MADTDTNHFLNMLRGSEAFGTDPLPTSEDINPQAQATNGDGSDVVIVKVDSDVLCLSGYYALASVEVHYRDNTQRPSTGLSTLLTRVFNRISGPSSNGLDPRDLLVKTSSASHSTLSSTPSTESLVPPSLHSGNPADYVVQGYMDRIVSGAVGSPFVSLRRPTNDESRRADSQGAPWFVALWLHVNADQAARSNHPGDYADTAADLPVSTTLKTLGGFPDSQSTGPGPFTTSASTSTNPSGPARALPSFSPLPAGTIAAAARAASLAAGAPASTSPHHKAANGKIPGSGDEVEIGRAFGARFGFGSLWGKVGLGKRPAAEVLAIVAPAVQVMREMNKRDFEHQGKHVKLTKKIMIQGLGIADKSFSPMETAFRRGQYLLNTVAEHSLVDDSGSVDLIGEVFTDRSSPLTVDDLYAANDRAHESVRKAALAKGLDELADMMHTDWAMGRHTWKNRSSEPRPSYVGDVVIDELRLRESSNLAGAGQDGVEDEDEDLDRTDELLDLDRAVAAAAAGAGEEDEEAEDLPVDPKLMAMTGGSRPDSRKRRRVEGGGQPSKRIG